MLIAVAVEDSLSESVAIRLIEEYAAQAEIARVTVLEGINNVKGQMRNLNQIALYQNPLLVLVDLDNPQSCPPALIRQLRGGLTVSPNMLIRVAVLEIESWIIADREGLANWLGLDVGTIPRNPESLSDPKRTLAQLAVRSRNRGLREAIAPTRVIGTHRTGLGYNDTLGEFVTQHWNPEAARRNAPSLDRAITRIAELVSAGPSP